MKNKIRVLIADDHAMVRMGLASLLGTEPDIEVVGEAENGKTAIQKSIALKPDVIVMDLVMPNMDGTAATTEILKCLPETKILMLTSFGTADGIAHAIEAGAKGAMMKNADFSELVAAIRTIAAGGRAISPEIEHFMEEDPPVQKLTQRQSDILASLVRGLTNDDIAKQFSIQRSSVKDHLTAIFEKLGAANRSEAVSIALRKHLLKT
jgi:NarL family two-component system response regulator LiaR